MTFSCELVVQTKKHSGGTLNDYYVLRAHALRRNTSKIVEGIKIQRNSLTIGLRAHTLEKKLYIKIKYVFI